MGVFDKIKNMYNDGLDDEDDFEDFEDYDDDFDDFDDSEESSGLFGNLFANRFKKKDSTEDDSLDDDISSSAKTSSDRYTDKSSDNISFTKREVDRKYDGGRYESTKSASGFSSSEKRQDKEANTKTGGARVIPMSKVVGNSNAAKQMAELYMIKPKTEEDARVAVDQLLSGKIVIINLEGLNLEIAQYITDFVTGANYSIGGNFDTINTQVLVFAPAGTAMSGDFEGDRTDSSKDY